MKIILTEIEKSSLKKLHKKLKDQRNLDRIKAITLLSENYTIIEVVKILLLERGTVARWIEKFNDKSLFTDWLGDKYKLYSGKLNSEQEEKIVSYVSGNIINDSKQIQEYIKTEFGINYTEFVVSFIEHISI